MDKKQIFRRKIPAFRSIEKQQKRKKLKRTLFYLVLIVAFCAIFFTLWFTVLFKVRNIEVEGNSRYTADEIIKASGITEGENIYGIDKADIENRLKNRLVYVDSVEIDRNLPSTVNIKLVEKRPVLYSNLYGDNYLVTDDLSVIERNNDTATDGLILLEAGDVKRCFAGETLEYCDSRMADCVKTMYTVLENYGLADEITSFTMKNRFDISVCYDNRIDIYFGTMDNIDVKVRFFVGILEHLYADDKGKLDISNIKEASFSRYNK